METKICPSCGNAIDIQLTYCPYCGAAQMPNTRVDAYPPRAHTAAMAPSGGSCAVSGSTDLYSPRTANAEIPRRRRHWRRLDRIFACYALDFLLHLGIGLCHCRHFNDCQRFAGRRNCHHPCRRFGSLPAHFRRYGLPEQCKQPAQDRK